jgi:hypothetical protein
VAFGKKTWVGYIPTFAMKEASYAIHRLPVIKPGVLSPIDGVASDSNTAEDYNNLNAIYARDYRVITDLKIIWKGFRKLGKG